VVRTAAILVFLWSASPAGAQVLGEFSELPRRIHPGDSITVVDLAGQAWSGRVAELTADRIVLEARERITFERERVQEVKHCCDPLMNGTVIGLAAGAAFGFAAAVRFSGETRIGDGIQGALMFGGIGAGVGLCLDAIFPRTVVLYRASRLSVELDAWPVGPAAGVILRW
jgi:hypothetical protein